MKNCWKIKLESYDVALLDRAIKNLLRSISEKRWPCSGVIMLPTKKMFITFCRSPHVDKLSMEQFVRYTHKRMFYINSSSSEIKDFIKEYADMPSGVTVNIHFEGGKE